ncbi:MULTISPECIES: AMP-binding protein [unclassified Actinobaculum]|uniref:class I adenylate-forming enzyme family protein n=1 Tax=unclassified Actinobaculum TaxID=2609299 RepID=UPI000D5264A4|nr:MULTISPECIES: AMP-binding protein [unclassified Actinobaculum]AWE41920.1 long-chain fatty acid--CoA ligase [Actinobaculum sp. 313]RTE50164.1 long-chain fatty acid--CoA ligase [Actinobaculum sp. 352]
MRKLPIFNAAFTLDRAAFDHPDRVSLTYGQQSWTVAQAATATRRLAQLLAQVGVSAGDRVMLVSHNSPYHLFFHIACARLGAVLVPVSFRLTQFELQALVDFCSPRTVICEPEVAARGSFTSTGTLMHFVIDDDVQAGPLTPGLAVGYLGLTAALIAFDGEFIADGADDGPLELNQHDYPEGLADIFFVAGTVGQPRGTELTHENLWWGSRNFRDALGYNNDDVALVAAPLSHVSGFNCVTLDLFASGGHVVITRDFDPAAILQMIEAHRVTVFFGMSTMYLALSGHPDFATRDLSSWRLPLVGGTHVPPPLLGRLASRHLRPLPVWGLPETAAAIAYLPFEHCAEYPGAVGRPFPHVAMRIVDPRTGEDLPEGQVGVVDVQGPAVAARYWHNDADSRATFPNGWFRTGDLGQMSDGVVTITGRYSEVIFSGGESVLPAEVEDVLIQYPGITEAVVCGVPDAIWGESVAAAITVDSGSPRPEVSDLLAFADQVLAGYKLPRRVIVVDTIPAGEEGVVDRAAVRAMLLDVPPLQSLEQAGSTAGIAAADIAVTASPEPFAATPGEEVSLNDDLTLRDSPAHESGTTSMERQ